MSLTDQLYALSRLVRRNLKLFLKDKAAVFFSLLAPMIVLLLFLLFLGDMQVDTVAVFLDAAGVAYTDKTVHAFVDSWMFAGVMGVACITVSFGANGVMVEDKQHGLLDDYTASPVRGWVVTAAYFIFNFIVTSLICLSVLFVSFIYLAAFGRFYMNAATAFALIGLTLVSALSATVITVFIASFFQSNNAFSAFSGILSAAVGFVIGAYMPLSMYPKAIQYIVLFVPGSYSAALYRSLFMQAPLDALCGSVPAMAEEIGKDFSMQMNFFGHTVPQGLLWGLLAASIALFVLLGILVPRGKKK